MVRLQDKPKKRPRRFGLDWIEKHPNYWVLIVRGVEIANVLHARKSFFAHCNGVNKHFHAYGIFKFQSREFRKAKEWCEEQFRLKDFCPDCGGNGDANCPMCIRARKQQPQEGGDE